MVTVMIKVENIDVWGFEHAIRGMRNPLNSWDKSDSRWCYANNRDESKCDAVCCDDCVHRFYEIGKNDLNLMRRLYKAGSEHRKYLRQICVSMDITSNHFWWPEFDTYKIGTTRNSCSKMHKIHVHPFSENQFSHEGISEVGGRTFEAFKMVLRELEYLKSKFNETKEKKYWRAMLEFLPMGFNIKATITMNYENVVNIIHQRTRHKLDEWNEFVEIIKNLPYVKEIIEEY